MVWKELSPFGHVNANEGVPALPRHILQELYQSGDKASFDNSPYWKEEWIGLGPYRLTRWEFGSFMEAAAFEQFVGGRPKIDRLRITYIGDANTLVANLLADTVDVVPSGAGLDVADQVVIRDRWAASGTQGTFFPSLKGVQSLSFQFRYPSPWAQDLRVRQALMHLLNRDLLAETQTEGAVPRADFLLLERDPVYKEAVARGLPTYPFDPARGQRLLADAGWTRTAGGPYRNSAGEEFPRFDVAGNQGSDNVRRQAAVANMWASAGFTSEPKAFSALRGLELAEETATYPAVVFRNWILGFLAFNRLATAEIASPENRWTGNNYGGWVNPAYQDLLGQFSKTIEPPARRELALGLVRLHAEQLPVIPLWFSGNPAIVRPGVTGVGEISPEVPATMWNVHTWAYN
jgi:peptide/nickel transport system substrate-binding protein